MDSVKFEKILEKYKSLNSKKTMFAHTIGSFKKLNDNQYKKLQNAIKSIKNNDKRRNFSKRFEERYGRNQIQTIGKTKKNENVNVINLDEIDKKISEKYLNEQIAILEKQKEELNFLNDPASEYLMVDLEKARKELKELIEIRRKLIEYFQMKSNIHMTTLPPVYHRNLQESKKTITPRDYMFEMINERKVRLENVIKFVKNTLSGAEGKKDGISKGILERRDNINQNVSIRPVNDHLYNAVMRTLYRFKKEKGTPNFEIKRSTNKLLTPKQYQLLIDVLRRKQILTKSSFELHGKMESKKKKIREICSAFDISYIGMHNDTTLPVAPFRTDASCGAGNHCPSLQSVLEFTTHTEAAPSTSSLFSILIKKVFKAFKKSTGKELRNTKIDFFIPRRFVVPLKYVDGLSSNLYASTEHGYAHNRRVYKGVNKKVGVPKTKLDNVEKLNTYIRLNIDAAKDSVILASYLDNLKKSNISLYDLTDFQGCRAKAYAIKYKSKRSANRNGSNDMKIYVEPITKTNAIDNETGYPWMMIVLQVNNEQIQKYFSGLDLDKYIKNGSFDVCKYALEKNGVTDLDNDKFVSIQLTPKNMTLVYNAYFKLK